VASLQGFESSCFCTNIQRAQEGKLNVVSCLVIASVGESVYKYKLEDSLDLSLAIPGVQIARVQSHTILALKEYIVPEVTPAVATTFALGGSL
jgi:hypothetical protein